MALSLENGFRIDCPQTFTRPAAASAIGGCLLALLLLCIYWPGFQGQWFLDDFSNIHENPNVHARSLSRAELSPAIYGRDTTRQKIDRPIAYLTLAINHALGGTDPIGYHIVNFLIHLLTAIAIYRLARTTLNLPLMAGRYGCASHAIALLGALLWAIHPIQVTAVTYTVQRMAAMAALFTVLAIIGYAKARTVENRSAKPIWFSLCAIFGLLALGSKQNAVMLPVSLYLYDLFFLAKPERQTTRRHLLWLFLAVAAIVAIAACHTGGDILTRGYANRPFTLYERLLTEPRVLFFYLWQIVYPVSAQFTLLHDVALSSGPLTPWYSLPVAALLALLAILAWIYRRQAPLPGFAWLFFLVNHVVESTVLPLELIYEHRNYLPSIFLFLAAAAGFLRAIHYFQNSRPVQMLAIACGIIFLISAGHTTHMRNSLFANGIDFWADNVAKAPALHRPRHNLGRAYLIAGDLDRGLIQIRRALKSKTLARINQKYISHFDLAMIYLHAGKEGNALVHLQKTLAIVPNHAEALNAMARLMLIGGQIRSATDYNTRALSLKPGSPDFLATRGLILLRRNQMHKALEQGRRALRSDPRNFLSLFLLGETLRGLGRLDSAAYFFRQSLINSPAPYAPILALIEITALQNNRAQTRQLVLKLLEQSSQKEIGPMVAAYQRQYNFLDPQRSQRITDAIQMFCNPYPL